MNVQTKTLKTEFFGHFSHVSDAQWPHTTRAAFLDGADTKHFYHCRKF